MLKFYRSGRFETLGDVSPFVYKLETWLRMSGIAFDVEVRPTGELLQEAPRNLIPFIDLDGERLDDSSLIINRLQRTHGGPLADQELSPHQVALGTLIKSLCEHELFYIMIYGRWRDGDYETFANFLVASLPEDQRPMAISMSVESVKNMLNGYRIGRYDTDFVRDALRSKLDALTHFLGEGPWLFGERPCTFDAGLYAILASFIHFPLPNPQVEISRGYSDLVSYCDRVKSTYYDPADWKHGS